MLTVFDRSYIISFHLLTRTTAIFERMRSILNEGMIDKRVQYMIEVLYAIRKDGFKVCARVYLHLCIVEERRFSVSIKYHNRKRGRHLGII